RELYDHWGRRLLAVPTLICLGFGLALNSTAAILETLLGTPGSFQRTPKFRLHGRTGSWKASSYALSAGRLVWGEVALTLYALLTLFAALGHGYAPAVPFLLLYVVGFGYVSVMSFVQAARPLPGKRKRRHS
ncbi:MAG TPA: hypothetical protein VM366_16375, partial [Anaerolineae bacterium]|nr:hypothetical protein [Anaerolineae bacterium]